MSESSSLKFHLELLRLIPKNYSISSLELREKLLALGIERDVRSIQRALNALCELGAESILYVSCNPATLVRDAEILRSFGYRIIKTAMIDMFPHTSHLESVTLFIK